MLSVSCKNHLTTTTVEENSGDYLLPENSSSSVIAGNSDLLIQILVCLPVKSLLVFKSVSKQWLSLICDPFFLHNFYLRNRRLSIPALFVRKLWSDDYFENEFILLDGRKITRGGDGGGGGGDVPFKTLTFLNDSIPPEVLQSCNGLLLCCSYGSFSWRGCFEDDYYIYNPSTKHCKLLPPSPFSSRERFSFSTDIRLAFDPLKSPHYEVVYIGIADRYNHRHIEIYSSKTGSWRVSEISFNFTDAMFFASGVFWNGSLNWISYLIDSILYFDIDRELLKTMSLPLIPDGYSQRNVQYFGECKGHMYLIEIYYPCTRFDVLEMDTDYTGWNVKYRVNLEALTIQNPYLFGDCPDYYLHCHILFVDEEEGKSARLVLLIPQNKVISYDLKEMSYKDIHEFAAQVYCASRTTHNGMFPVHQYVETLVGV